MEEHNTPPVHETAHRHGLRFRAPGWRWLLDLRLASTVVSGALVVYALVWASIPPGGGSPDIREIPGAIGSVVTQALGSAQPEAGYPRIRIDRVKIDLLLAKGDGKAPPVKAEAFTYPGADHLLTTGTPGGGNSYVYAHARQGMFWALHDLRIGDVVTVDYGGGKVLKYRVSELHPKVNWRDFKWLSPTTDDRLTLQTCNGWKDDDPRFIVVARRIQDATALNN
ncbi:MAG: sortase [Candidatus Dormibacteria bacterium]